MNRHASAVALVVGAALVAVGSYLPVVEADVALAERPAPQGVMAYVWMESVALSVLHCAAGGPRGTVQIHDTYIETGDTPGAWPARLLLGSLLVSVGLVGAGLRRAGLAASVALLLSIGWLFAAIGAPRVGAPPATGGPEAGWTAYPPLSSAPAPASLPLSNSWAVWAALAAGGLLVLASAWLRRGPRV